MVEYDCMTLHMDVNLGMLTYTGECSARLHGLTESAAISEGWDDN
jgi:hypothetical protein